MIDDPMTTKEVAALLGKSVRQVLRYQAENKGPPFYRDGITERPVYSRREVEAWMASSRYTAQNCA